MTTAAQQLAGFVSSTPAEALPEDRREEARRLLLDYLGVALAGSQTDSGRIAADTMISVAGLPQATVLGRNVKIPAMNAALANATSEHSIELDDVDDEALFHYGPPVVSAALAAAEWQGSSGTDLLAAVLLGCEVMNRLSLATNPRLRDRAFHTTPACGVFGATAAAGRLLGLSAVQLTSAFGIAGAQASGLMEMYGPSMQKRINPGPAARNGVTAVMLAGNGYTGADTIFEGERGFGTAFAGGIDLEILLSELGSRYTFVVEYKPYSAARPIHNAIDGALALRERGVTAEDVAALAVYRHPAWSHYHRNAAPQTYHEAQVSLQYSTAIALLEGGALPPQYADSLLARPVVRELISKISIETDESLPRGVSCRLELVRPDGSTEVVQIDDPKGSVRNPMTNEDLAAKFTQLASPVLTDDPAAPKSIIDAVRGIETVEDIGQLISLCHPGGDHAA
jgi:2-methylcitrate dehydratase PrpD